MSTTEEDLKKISAAEKAVQQAEEQLYSANEQANNDYIAGYDARTQDLQSQLQQSNENVNNAALSYSNIIASWEDAMKQYQDKLQKEAEEKNKQEQKAIKLGGLAGVANAIVNLIGTSKGAANQQQSDFVSKWQARADAARKERESKLGSYRDQIKNLEAQRALLQYNFAKEKASADSKLAALITQRNDNAGQMRAKSASDNAAGKAKLAADNYTRALKSFNSALQRDKAANDAYIKSEQARVRTLEAEARIQTERSKQLANGYDVLTGKFYNPKTRKYDSDSFIASPAKGKKSFSDYTAADWRGFRDKYAKHAGFEGGYQDYVKMASLKNGSKEDKKKYAEWLRSHPEEQQVLEWLASPIDLQKGELNNLLIMQSVVNALEDELSASDAKSKTNPIINNSTTTESKPITQDKDGYIHGGYLLGKQQGVTYDDNNKVELP